MAIFLTSESRVIVQGMTGSEGRKHTARMLSSGTTIVGVDPEDDATIWVSEVWDSADAHAASLQLPSVRAAIERAMPMLTGDFTGQRVSVAGGLGVPAGA